jgi:hypothetical protein
MIRDRELLEGLRGSRTMSPRKPVPALFSFQRVMGMETKKAQGDVGNTLFISQGCPACLFVKPPFPVLLSLLCFQSIPLAIGAMRVTADYSTLPASSIPALTPKARSCLEME